MVSGKRKIVSGLRKMVSGQRKMVSGLKKNGVRTEEMGHNRGKWCQD